MSIIKYNDNEDVQQKADPTASLIRDMIMRNSQSWPLPRLFTDTLERASIRTIEMKQTCILVRGNTHTPDMFIIVILPIKGNFVKFICSWLMWLDSLPEFRNVVEHCMVSGGLIQTN